MNDATLLEKQFLFSRLLPSLIREANQLGMEVQGGEWWRTPEQAAWNAAHGLGICHSEHCLRLAQDINLWRNGVLLNSIEDYRPIGEVWKSLSTPGYECCWGGDFSKPDIFHFSIEHNGVR